MRQKTKKSTRTTKKTDSFKKQFNHEIKGVFLIGFGLLLAISVHALGAGAVGEWIRNVSMGLFSNAAYILPYLTILLGILTLLNHPIWQERRSMIFFAAVMTGILIYLTLWDMEFIEALRELTLMEQIKAAFIWGSEGVSGGLLGILLTTILVGLFGRTGAYIIVTCFLIVSAMVYTDLSLLKLIRGINSFVLRALTGAKNLIMGFVFVEQEEKDLVIEEKYPAEKKDKKDKTAHMLKQMDIFNEEIDGKSAVTQAEQEEEAESEIKIEDYTPAEKVNTAPAAVAGAGKPAEGAEEDDSELVIEDHQALSDIPYEMPGFDLLNEIDQPANKEDKKRIIKKAKILEETLHNFGVEARVIKVSKGPVITRYELQPSVGVKVSKIVNLNDDIALNMAAPAIRIEAPIPGKAAIGIEIPNEDVSMVTFREVIDSNEFTQGTAKVPFALGKDISGCPVVTDITKMPHLMIAGATGSGKSVCINTLLLSVLYAAKPDEVKLILIDPKVVELSQYNGLPHLLIPVVTDPKKATNALNWAVHEMTRRYQLFAENGVKDIGSYNNKMPETKLPFIVIVIDELADLMMVAANDVEDAICRLAQMARAAGLHLILATQRPSVDIITGVIKANVPSRIAFSVASQTDSRTILDMGGAEKLLGKGDMLFYPMGANKPVRLQGAFISEKEVERVVGFIKGQTERIQYQADLVEKLDSNEPMDLSSGEDDLFNQAVEMVIEGKQASISMLQRRLRIGYNRAARLIDEMEARGIIGPHEGSKPRQVLVRELTEQQARQSNG